jgi:CTP:molybdopterin cytidylyltransferase MocA
MGAMTVAAVILFARGAESALADAAGRAVARRTVESAWAGGATPIVVVCADPLGQVAAALAGSPAVLAEPAPAQTGPVGQIVRGIDIAAATITETDAVMIWPGRMAWVDAETVTTLIEAHGAYRDALLRPRYGDATGWPALLPMDVLPVLRAQATNRMPDELLADLIAGGMRQVEIDTGDPGTAFDISTPLDSLPTYDGPAEPVAGRAPEWGAAAADMPDDAPLEGPALAPYGQASEEGE